MNFRLSRQETIFLALLTLAIGLIQVITPLLLRTLVDGILPSKDGQAIFYVTSIVVINEFLLVLGNSQLNRTLDEIERLKLQNFKGWMLSEVSLPGLNLRNADQFFDSWTQDSKRIIYKKFKNPWLRIKDFIILCLLSIICLNISSLAGLLILSVSGISMSMVLIYQSKQGKEFKELSNLQQEERKIFSIVFHTSNGLEEKENNIQELLSVSQRVNQIQAKLTGQKTQHQDMNNFIRFLMMGTILGVGGYLFSREKISMGSLWALLITMYRMTPPLQSLIRWLLQVKTEENIEERIATSMKTAESFKKPKYYNRLVKTIEKFLQEEKQLIVILPKGVRYTEVKDALIFWRNYYKGRDRIQVLEHIQDQESNKIKFILGPVVEVIPEKSMLFLTAEYDGKLTSYDGTIINLETTH
jgi:ABC-type protease/lipase transport system fused ATPase/permease subunit